MYLQNRVTEFIFQKYVALNRHVLLDLGFIYIISTIRTTTIVLGSQTRVSTTELYKHIVVMLR